MPPAVERYLTFSGATKERLHASGDKRAGEPTNQEGGAPAEIPPMTIAHEYTAAGLRDLADALTAVQGTLASPVAQSLRKDADELQANPESLRHADILRDAFDKVAETVGRTAPEDGRRLRDLASSIDVKRPLLDQSDIVQQLFVAAGDAVRQMTRSS
jgi:hypothetical protein